MSFPIPGLQGWEGGTFTGCLEGGAERKQCSPWQPGVLQRPCWLEGLAVKCAWPLAALEGSSGLWHLPSAPPCWFHLWTTGPTWPCWMLELGLPFTPPSPLAEPSPPCRYPASGSPTHPMDPQPGDDVSNCHSFGFPYNASGRAQVSFFGVGAFPQGWTVATWGQSRRTPEGALQTAGHQPEVLWDVRGLHRPTLPHRLGQGFKSVQQLQDHGDHTWPLGATEEWAQPSSPRDKQQTPPAPSGKFISWSEKEKQGQVPVRSSSGPDQGGARRGGTGVGSGSCARLVPQLSWLGLGRACRGWWHRAWGQRWQASGPRGRHTWRQ